MTLNVGELVAQLRVGAEGMRQGLTDGESRFRKFSDKLVGLAAAGGLLIGGALMAGLVSAMDQDAIGAKIAANQGQGIEEAHKYGAAAGKVWAAGWGESVEAVGDTMNTVLGAGLVGEAAGNDIESLTRKAQILSDVMGADVKGSVEAVQQMIRNGLVPDAAAGFDLIAAGMQGGVDKAEDLNDTMIEYSTKFRDMGLSGAQALGLMSQGLKAGARDADTVADSIKEFQIRATDGSTSSADAFKALGLNAQKMTTQFSKGGQGAADGLQLVLTKLKAMKDPVARNAAAVGLFGTKAEDLGQALYALDLNTAATGFDNVAGAVDKAGKTVAETDSAKLERFKRSAQQMATTIAADLVPSLASMGKWIKENQAWIKPLAIALGTLAAAIILVNLATRAWTAAEAAFTTVKAVATSANWLFSASLWATLGPILLIVAGIALLVAAIYLIATKTTWFQTAWNWAWGGIKAGALAVWDWIKNTLWPGMKAAWDFIANAAIAAKDRFVNGWRSVISFLTGFRDSVKAVFAAVGDFIGAGFERGKNAARGAINVLIGMVNNAIGGMNTLISGANKIPGVHIPTIGTIPKLAGGGTVMPNGSTGTPVIMGDGGEVEYGIPKSDMVSIIRDAVAAGRGAGGTQGGVITVKADRNEFFRWLRFEINAKGGNVQKVLAGVG